MIYGSDFVAGLPASPSSGREQGIIDVVVRGDNLPILWCPVQSTVGDNVATFYVSSDALSVGTIDDYVRVNVSHTGAQRIADHLGAALPTTRLSDLIFAQAACQIRPCTFPPDALMASTARMVQHSKTVDGKCRPGASTSLISTVGKDWVLTNRLVGKPNLAANYGWHSPTSRFLGPGGARVLQPLGLAHNRYHVDYSQVLRLIHRRVLVNGTEMLLEDVLQDPVLAPLASDEGVLQITRHPGVAKEVEVDPPALEI